MRIATHMVKRLPKRTSIDIYTIVFVVSITNSHLPIFNAPNIQCSQFQFGCCHSKLGNESRIVTYHRSIVGTTNLGHLVHLFTPWLWGLDVHHKWFTTHRRSVDIQCTFGNIDGTKILCNHLSKTSDGMESIYDSNLYDIERNQEEEII